MTDVIASPNFLAYFNTNSTSPIIGAINSTFSGGAVFGALMGGLTMDRFGRKKTVQIGALIAAVGAILQCAAVDLAMILVGRIISGWAVSLVLSCLDLKQTDTFVRLGSCQCLCRSIKPNAPTPECEV